MSRVTVQYLLKTIEKHCYSKSGKVSSCPYRWRRNWQEAVLSRGRLTACITRQRISLRLYKQQYWQAIDAEVQVK